jgi:hypothetical protein
MNVGDKIKIHSTVTHPNTIGLIGELISEIEGHGSKYYLIKFETDIDSGCDGCVDDGWQDVQGVTPREHSQSRAYCYYRKGSEQEILEVQEPDFTEILENIIKRASS